MNWKCLLFHDYKLEASYPFDIIDEEKNPIGSKTNFLYVCSRCHKVKCQTINGYWNVKKNQSSEEKGALACAQDKEKCE